MGEGENAWRHRAPETRYVRVIKPALDQVLALLLGIVLAPLIAAVSLAVLVRLGRPVIFAQARVGRAGELFTLYKFRSMTPDRRIGQLPYQWAERRLSYEATDDPRHTRLGLFLRTWSLDELPQLLNVFIGDMSLIGPRPEVPQVVAGYTERQHARHRVRPGMTGLWQVTCRAAKPMHAHVELDLDYVERVSPGLDASILLKTVPVVVGGSRRWFGGLADPSDDADPVS